MQIHKLLITCLFSVQLMSLSAQQSYIVRIPDVQGHTINEVKIPDLEITHVEQNEYFEVLVNEEQFRWLKEHNFNPEIIKSKKDLIGNLQAGLLLEGYHTYDEIVNILQGYANKHPDICALYDIGNSRGKEYFASGLEAYEDYQHDFWALKISDNPQVEEDEPSLLYDAAHHARETIGPAVVLNFTQHLLENYGSDPTITEAINKNQIWIIPLVNPDGYKIVTDSLEVWWRKTIRDNNGNQQIDPFIPDWIEPDGVDPNRNYGIYWGGDWNSAPWFRETYRGPSSFSEPCNRAMRDLMKSHHFVAELSYHSYGEIFYYPWGHNTVQYQTPDHQLFFALGAELAGMTPKLASGNYAAQSSAQVFMLTGSTSDYAYGKHGIISFTVELAQDFIPPPEDIMPVCDANLNSQLYLLERVHRSILTGHVKDLYTSNPIAATVCIEGIDNDPNGRYDYKSDSLFGRYYRLLNPGDYEVNFRAFGYQPQTFNVSIDDAGPTELEVNLDTAGSFELNGLVVDADGNPIPGAQVVIADIPVDTSFTDGSGTFTIDPFFAGEYLVKISAENYATKDFMTEIDHQNNHSVFALNFYDVIDFENEDELDHFQMAGHQEWVRDDQFSFHGDHSLAAPVLLLKQFASSSLAFYFETEKLMTLATRVSLDSVAQGMIFTMDEKIMKTYCGMETWVLDTFFIPPGNHTFKWSLSRGFKTPAPFYQNKCWIDHIEFHDLYTIIDEIGHEEEMLFSCFPNPSNGRFYINFKAGINEVYYVAIFDVAGRLIAHPDISKVTSGNLIWDACYSSGLQVPAGLYFIKIVTDQGIGTEKLIKK